MLTFPHFVSVSFAAQLMHFAVGPWLYGAE